MLPLAPVTASPREVKMSVLSSDEITGLCSEYGVLIVGPRFFTKISFGELN